MRSFTKILLLSACLMMTSESIAYSCSGGQSEIINNIQFCKSNQVMNWLSALTWCDANGGKLAEYNTVCPGGDCSEFKGKFPTDHWGYLNKFSGKKVSRINFSTGEIRDNNTAINRPIGYDYEGAGLNEYDKRAITDIHALCQPK